MHERKAQVVSKTNGMHGLCSWSQEPQAAPEPLSAVSLLMPCIQLVTVMIKTLRAAAAMATPVRAIGS